MALSRNALYVLLLAAAVAVGALGYKVYQDNRQPQGVEIKVGPQGLSIKEN